MNRSAPEPTEGDALLSPAELSEAAALEDSLEVDSEADSDSDDPEMERTTAALVPVDRGALVARGGDDSLELVDALTRYMAELRHHAPDLARRGARCSRCAGPRRATPRPPASSCSSNLRLVVKIAMEYRRAWTNVLDLIQEGNVGLVQAVQRFDPFQGTQLSSYAAYWIRAYILKYLIDNIRLVRLGTSRAQRKLFFRLNKEKRELERQGFEAGPKLLAERLDVSEADVIDMEQRLAESDLSMDAPVGDEGGQRVASATSSPSGRRVRRGARRRLASCGASSWSTSTSSPRASTSASGRSWSERILADEPLTLQELGDELGVTRERVRQLEKKLVEDAPRAT